MSTSFADYVRVQTATQGTGTATCGTAVPGFRGTSALVDGATYSYSVQDQNNAFEGGKAIFSASAQTLTRANVLWSSNGGSPLVLSGNAIITITAFGEDVAASDLSNLAPSAALSLSPVEAPESPASHCGILFIDSSDYYMKVLRSDGTNIALGYMP